MKGILAFVKQLIGSVGQLEFYRQAIQRSVVQALMYLLLLYVCAYMVIGVKIYVETSRMIDTLAVTLQTKVPDFVLQDATLTVNAKMPYVVEDSAEERSFVIIDTSGKLDEGVLAKYEHGCFIAAHKLVWKIDSLQTITCDFPSMQGVTLVKQNILAGLPVMKYVMVPGILLLVFVVEYIGQLITCWMLAVMGSLMAGVMNFPLPFVNVFKIGIYSFTISVIVSVPVVLFAPTALASGFADSFLLFYYAFYYGMPVVYLMTVVQFLRDQQEQQRQ